ncbi:MAG TPA: hypothetical protein VES02_14230 [Dermatophilaceae bacterium]|nr:hypothetical protein [Dermatophilaceae bacterium]
MSKPAARWCLPVVLLLALAACSGSGQTRSVSVAGTAADAQPSTENTTALEKPQAPREGNPGIPVATLPVGGASEGLLGSDGAQCLPVSWSRIDIPAGYAAAVGDVTFEPEVFLTASRGCPNPPCHGYVFRSSSGACDVPVRPKDPSETALGDSAVAVSVTGLVLCPDESSDACAEFRTAVLSAPPSLSIQQPAKPALPETGAGSGAAPGTTTADTGSVRTGP